MVKLILDPGHGGSDSGAVGNGLKEKDLTLEISKRIKKMLEAYEVDVRLTRDTDKTLSLKQRTDMANAYGADYLCSIHINAGGGEGYEDFIYPSSPASTIAHQNVVHAEIMKQVDFKDRGKKRANFHMVRESHMSAILTENGFIDNARDAAKLKSSAYLDKIARGHVNGFVKAFGIKKKPAPVKPATPKPGATAPAGKLYKVQAGAFKNRDGAEAIVKKLKSHGIEAVIVLD